MLRTNIALSLLLLSLAGLSTDSFANGGLYSWILTIKGNNPSVYTGSITNTLTTSSRTPERSAPEVDGCSCYPSEYKTIETSSVMNLRLNNPGLPPPRVSVPWLFSQSQTSGLFTTTTRHTLKVITNDCSKCCNSFYRSSCCGYRAASGNEKDCDECLCECALCCFFPCIMPVLFAEEFRKHQGSHVQAAQSSLNASTSYQLTEPVRITHMSISSTTGESGTQVLPMPIETQSIHLERSDRSTQMWLHRVIERSIHTQSRVTFPGFLQYSVEVLLQVTESQQNNSNYTITMQAIQSDYINSISMEVSRLLSSSRRGQGRRVNYQIEKLTFETSDTQLIVSRGNREYVHTEQPTPSAPPWEPDELQLPDASQIYNPGGAPPAYTLYPDGNSGSPPGK